MRGDHEDERQSRKERLKKRQGGRSGYLPCKRAEEPGVEDRKKEGERLRREKEGGRVKRRGLEGKAWVTLKKKELRKTKGVRRGCNSEAWGDEKLPAYETFFPAAAATAVGADSCTDGRSRPADRTQVSPGLGMGQDRPPGAKSDEVREGVTLGGLLSWLDSRMDAFLARHCKTMTTGRLFPLPSSSCFLASRYPQVSPEVRVVLRCLVLSLNSLNGEGIQGPEFASEYQMVVLDGLCEDCRRVSSWELADRDLSWKSFFRVKGVDYKGDEVLTAQYMSWENVAPALPPEVGSVALEDVLDLGCKHYVLNFEDYLLEPEDQVQVKPPRVMVAPEHWSDFCTNLMRLGVFSRVHEDDLYRVKGSPVLNGLFGVSKHEFQGCTEIMRVIMNLIPLNSACRGIDGEVSTLPSWAGMAPLHLQPHEQLLVSSEDVRAFFYIFRVPQSWHRFLGFNRPLPDHLCGDRPGRWYPCSAVLPMGFRNSVSLAQAVHRFIVRKALARNPFQGGESELRKDRSFSTSNPVYRIYLDNFDELEKTSRDMAKVIAGQVSPLTESLQETYAVLGVPRHPKKAVARQLRAEVQGAILDGDLGLAYPKVDKVMKYVRLALLLLEEGFSTQKQMQVVGGGLVYLAMFRRPLLGGLNHIWEFIVKFEGQPPVVKMAIPHPVKQEIARFIGMVPLAYMNFRCSISPVVTASDASERGGGVTASAGLTPMGMIASTCSVRGDLLEPSDISGVLTIGLFDGIAALRVATDSLGWNVLGHVSIEKNAAASRVVETQFPNSILVSSVEQVDLEMVKTWSQMFSQVALVLVGAGPPCQGVSGLNAARKGALKDERSALFVHVARIRDLAKQCFPWAQVRSLMESVASMNSADEEIMSTSFGCKPWFIDASGLSLAHRPRLYWIDWELLNDTHPILGHTQDGRKSVSLDVKIDPKQFLLAGWKKVEDGKFPTFTTSRPRTSPGYKPAGLKQASEQDLERWKNDDYRFPPYQYQLKHCVQNKKGALRLPNVQEREVIMGFPKDFTHNCVPKQQQGSQLHADTRLTLIGNSWNVSVVAWLLSQLGHPLGLNARFTPEEIVQRTSPGCSSELQTYLRRPPLNSQGKSSSEPARALTLVEKLMTMVSVKGEDIMLQSASEDLAKYHRLRSSVPARLWKWSTVASWQWTGEKEHINSLELRAVLTSLRWRLERHKKVQVKFVHLLDSLVGMHSLSRGRSSSRRLRRTVLRINALLLATRSQGVWAYVHTKQNPADAPSRRPLKRKWTRCQSAI